LRGRTRAREIVAMVNGWLFNQCAIEQNAAQTRISTGLCGRRQARPALAPQ
jgi:hypothetical protein